jgi:hypothetical protein
MRVESNCCRPVRPPTPPGERYFSFFCFLAARFSFRFFLGCFLTDFPPLSLLAMCPPDVELFSIMRDSDGLAKPFIVH